MNARYPCVKVIYKVGLETKCYFPAVLPTNSQPTMGFQFILKNSVNKTSPYITAKILIPISHP